MAILTTWFLIGILMPLLVYFYFWMKKKHSYWINQKVAHEKPVPFLGSLLPVAKFSHSFGDIYDDAYRKFPKEKMVGVYEVFDPVLVIRNPELIEKILVKDFQYFTDHPSFVPDTSIFSTGLFNLKGNHWRSVRYKISPSFTSGKLKLMFLQMLDCCDLFTKSLRKDKRDCEIKQYISSLALDIVATTVFGIEMKEEHSRKTFEIMSRRIFNSGLMTFIKQIFILLLPNFSNKLRLRFNSPEVEQYFHDLATETINQRLENNVQRNDYLQHLIRLKEKGYIEFQDKDQEDNYLELDSSVPQQNFEITDKFLAGQALQFLLAGYDPLVTACLYAIYELAQNQDAQQKAREEIKSVLTKNGGYSYASLKEMTYVDQCIQETLRLHPLAQFIMRICNKTYITSDGVEIEKDTRLMIPLQALHTDPLYFDDPDSFKPERFAPGIKPPRIYLPFGDGPRICIGMRYALLVQKLILVKLTENFKYTVSKKTKLPLEKNLLSFFPTLSTKLMFDLVEINL